MRKLVGVADAGSYVRAATLLHVSQPALSVAIAKLERELGAQLFERGVRPLTLTPAGQLAYRTGQDILAGTRNLQLAVAEYAKREITIRLGMIDSVAGVLFDIPGSAEMLEQQATVSIVVDNSHNLVRLVTEGRLDAALATGHGRYGDMVEVLHTGSEPMAVVVGTAMSTAVQSAVQQSRLPYFMSYNQTSVTQRLVADALNQAGIVPQVAFYSTSPEIMLKMALLGKGVAALPLTLVHAYLVSGQLQTVRTAAGPIKVVRPIHAIKRAGATLPGSLSGALEHMCTQLDDFYGTMSASLE